MEKRYTIRQKLKIFSVLALVIPLGVFTVFSQIQVGDQAEEMIEENIERDLHNVDIAAGMLFDKYVSILHTVCTDEDIVRITKNFNRSDFQLEADLRRLRRELMHVGDWNEGVEGVTLVTESGKTFFYDSRAGSSEYSSWAGLIRAPEFGEDVAYGGGDILSWGGGDVALVRIAHRVIDEENPRQKIAAVILSINQDVLWNVLDVQTEAEIFICDGDTIVMAKDSDQIGKNITEIDKKGRRVRRIRNEESGWIIYDLQPTTPYWRTVFGNMQIWLLNMMLMLLAVLGVFWYVTTPILNKVDELTEAMSRVEEGDFSVRVACTSHQPKELEQIYYGFNAMARRLGTLIEQMQKTAEERKNAELSAMEAQIDPHFLYNTLDTINWKAIEHGDYEVSGMLGALADIMRYSIRRPGDTVSIGQELHWLSQYVMLQKEKLEQPLELVIDVSEEIKECRIHKLLLQPIVENAINHGMYQKKEPCRLEIRMGMAGNQIHVSVRDNGKGIPREMLEQLNDPDCKLEGHVGVINVRKRLELYYGEDAELYFESEEHRGTTVHLFVRTIRGEEVGNG